MSPINEHDEGLNPEAGVVCTTVAGILVKKVGGAAVGAAVGGAIGALGYLGGPVAGTVTVRFGMLLGRKYGDDWIGPPFAPVSGYLCGVFVPSD